MIDYLVDMRPLAADETSSAHYFKADLSRVIILLRLQQSCVKKKENCNAWNVIKDLKFTPQTSLNAQKIIMSSEETHSQNKSSHRVWNKYSSRWKRSENAKTPHQVKKAEDCQVLTSPAGIDLPAGADDRHSPLAAVDIRTICSSRETQRSSILVRLAGRRSFSLFELKGNETLIWRMTWNIYRHLKSFRSHLWVSIINLELGLLQKSTRRVCYYTIWWVSRQSNHNLLANCLKAWKYKQPWSRYSFIKLKKDVFLISLQMFFNTDRAKVSKKWRLHPPFRDYVEKHLQRNT